MAYKNKFKIAVAGAAEAHVCSKTAIKLAKEIGKEIVRQGCILITGATTGIPHYAAIGVKAAKGISIGFSPAATEIAHVKKYRLPHDAFDVIIYTGFGYAGRNLLMTRAADGVIIICGRMGTLNEFTIAFEDEKPIGIMLGSGGIADEIKQIVKRPFRGKMNMVFSTEPKELVKQLIKLIKKEKGRL
ncbi:MAG: hypothetical protein ABIA08_00955 [bacterium]